MIKAEFIYWKFIYFKWEIAYEYIAIKKLSAFRF